MIRLIRAAFIFLACAIAAPRWRSSRFALAS